MNRRRAVVIGGSMGGLFAGLLLHRIGFEVGIYERAGAELSSRGAGIVTHPELREAMVLAGADPGDRLGVPVDGRIVLAQDGTTVCAGPLPQVLTSWDRVYLMLRAACPGGIYHHGRALERVEQTEAEAIAHFADGGSVRGDLLIGADGILSTVRRQYLPDLAPNYAGYCAWRGLVDEADLSPETRDRIFLKFAFCLPRCEQMLGYPVAGPKEDLRPGHRRYNFVWYRPADAETDLPRLFTGADGKNYGTSIPPNRIHPDVSAEMRADAERLLAPEFAEIVRKTKQPFLQAIFDLEVPRMTFRRIAILGDAAFVARPHVGIGVTKAAGDAVALSRAMDRSAELATALSAFDAERQPYGAKVIRRARHLGAYMQAQILTPEERALAEKHRRPEAVMTETAVATGLSEW